MLQVRQKQAGFTLLEMLFAISISGVAMAMVVSFMVTSQNTYAEDVVRTRINSNLRTAMDVIALNIRQAGEKSPKRFDVIKLEDGASGASDRLVLRRVLYSGALTLCHDRHPGATELPVTSSHDWDRDKECVPGNSENIRNDFIDMRTDNGGTLKIFIIDKITLESEFLDYTGERFHYKQDRLITSPITKSYDKKDANFYIIEEWAYELDQSTNTLMLFKNGDTANGEALVFGVTDFQVKIEMFGDVFLDEYDTSNSPYFWKNIRGVEIVLSGEEVRKNRTFTSSITSTYFPRNVLSERMTALPDLE